MEASAQRAAERTAYYEYDRILIREAIPEQGVKEGEVGSVEGLRLSNNTVFASVKVYRSTRQTKGTVEMKVRPEREVVSFAPVA